VKPKTLLSLVSSIEATEPSSYSQASKNPKWVAAMTDEFNALIANETRELVPPPFIIMLFVVNGFTK